jgi:hypothetical protein
MAILLCVIAASIVVAGCLSGLVVAGLVAELWAALVLASGMTLSPEDIAEAQDPDRGAGQTLSVTRPWYRPFGPADVRPESLLRGTVTSRGHSLRMHRNSWMCIFLLLFGVALQLIGTVLDIVPY